MIIVFVLDLGSLGVTRSYVVEMTDVKEKMTYKLSRLSALQYAGFAATPLLGSALAICGAQISTYFEYSLSPYFLLFLVTLSIILLIYPFMDVDKLRDRYAIEALLVDSNIHNPLSDAEENAKQETPARKSEGETNVKESTDYGMIRHGSIQFLPGNNNYGRLPTHGDDSDEVKGDNFVGVEKKQPVVEEAQDSSDEHDELMKVRSNLYYFMMFLNFTTRGALSVTSF